MLLLVHDLLIFVFLVWLADAVLRLLGFSLVPDVFLQYVRGELGQGWGESLGRHKCMLCCKRVHTTTYVADAADA